MTEVNLIDPELVKLKTLQIVLEAEAKIRKSWIRCRIQDVPTKAGTLKNIKLILKATGTISWMRKQRNAWAIEGVLNIGWEIRNRLKLLADYLKKDPVVEVCPGLSINDVRSLIPHFRISLDPTTDTYSDILSVLKRVYIIQYVTKLFGDINEGKLGNKRKFDFVENRSWREPDSEVHQSGGSSDSNVQETDGGLGPTPVQHS